MNYITTYAKYLKTFIKQNTNLKVVFDASNGPAGLVVRELLTSNNSITPFIINDEIDPEFSAHGPNPLKDKATEQCAQKILEKYADLGIVFDADGDRAVIIDNEGVVLPSYATAILLFSGSHGPYVADELVYMSLTKAAGKLKQESIASKVGSFYVKQEMKSSGASVGAELSGHYYFKDFFGADSGILAAIKVINAASRLSSPLSEFRKKVAIEEIVSDEISLRNLNWHEVSAQIISHYNERGVLRTLDGITIDTGTLWFNIRPSNTEPILRFTGGGTDTAQLVKEKDTILNIINEIR